MAVPVEVYLSSSYEPEPEYVDGRLVDRHTGDVDHGYLTVSMAVLLDQRGLRPLISVTIQISPTRFRVPDVVATLQRPAGRFIEQPPYIVVEVLSPDDRALEFADKIDDYIHFGVPNIWVVEPDKRRVTVHTRHGARIHRDHVETADGKISIPLAELFAEMPVFEEE